MNSIGAIENAIKAVIMSELRDQTDFIKDVFGNIIDFMNEVFIAPTTRKLVDILVISQIETGRCYFIVEAKTDLFRINDLTQVLSYMDLFTQKGIFKLNLDKIAGCTISKRIESAAMEFVSLLNELDIFGKIHVINYVPRNKGQDTKFLYKIPPVQFIETAPQLPHLPAHLSYDDITERKILNIPFCELPQNVNLKVREKNEEGKQYLLEKIMGKDSTHIDYMYLEFLRGVLEWKQFINFMLNYKNLVERIGSKDYMEVIPIICAPEIDPKVSRFVELYNEYYKRKPIKLFLF